MKKKPISIKLCGRVWRKYSQLRWIYTWEIYKYIYSEISDLCDIAHSTFSQIYNARINWDFKALFEQLKSNCIVNSNFQRNLM